MNKEMLASIPKFILLALLHHLGAISVLGTQKILTKGGIKNIAGDNKSDYTSFYTKSKEIHGRRQRSQHDCRQALDSSICGTVSLVPPAVSEEYSLDPFYKKYTQTYGIPILSSGRVSDAALRRACHTVRFLISDRADIRQSLYDGMARVSIIGIDEQTTEIPEYRYLEDSWNERTRGLGGTPRNPVTVVAEENLLCLDQSTDRWWEEDELVHEFTHAIHLIALDYTDPTFRGRLKDAFLHAFRTGLWSNSDGGTNMNEYLAEGAQTFFNVNDHVFADGIKSVVGHDTRQALYNHDKQLYLLLTEIFPCGNIILDRCSNQSLVESWSIRKDCSTTPSTSPTNPDSLIPVNHSSDESSLLITTDRITSTSNPAPMTSPSTDRSEQSAVTTIKRSPIGVSTTLATPKKTSSATEDDCSDIIPFCSDLISIEECHTNPVKRALCRKTCRSCAGCHDYHRLCVKLSERGFCSTKEDYMTSNCPRSCGKCR